MRVSYRMAFAAAAVVGLTAFASGPNPAYAQDVVDEPMGLGFVSPRVESGLTLYFRGGPEFDAPAVDSITFRDRDHYVDIATAPPWLVPEHLKLDYGILLFRVASISRHAIELVVNKPTGQTAWVHRSDVEFRSWPEFLSEVFAVEQLDAAANPIRPRPFTYSDPAAAQPDPSMGFLSVLQVRGDWLQVQHMDDELNATDPPGWIRWRDGQRLLISWSLLS